MGLADLTSRDAVLAAIREFDELGRDAFLSKYGFGPARRYLVKLDGRLYDSKAIVGVAHGFEHADDGPLRHDEFAGGETTTKAKLEELGFEVVAKEAVGAGASVEPFAVEDCAFLAVKRGRWPEVSDDDKERYKDLKRRLSALADAIAPGAIGSVAIKPAASMYNPSNYAAKDLWCCVYPAAIKNKSYALQVAFIVSESGAEMCFCLGSGYARERSEESRVANMEAFERTKARLAALPSEIRGSAEAALKGWQFRNEWRQVAHSDFSALDAWLKYASSPDGNGASISRNLSPDELEAMGTGVIEPLHALVDAVTPIFEYVYGEHETVSDDPALALAEELRWPIARASHLVKLAGRSKQLLFAGPPGTGKTFVAQALARVLGGKDAVELVQFHPSYAYEDFIEGIRPRVVGGDSADGGGLTFHLRDGILKRQIERASGAPQKSFFLIIDEINRANIPRVFGELLYGLEYRGAEYPIVLPYSDTPLSIPENLWLIGTMNSADRSIALMDAALRRRFRHVTFMPDYDVLEAWLTDHVDDEVAATARARLKALNDALAGLLDSDRLIGHSYLMKEDLAEIGFETVWEEEIEPVLREHLFNRPEDELTQLRDLFLAA